MNGSPEQKDRIGKPNQLLKPECCLKEGQAQPLKGAKAEQPAGSVHRETCRPQAEVASRLSNTASKRSNAGGDEVAHSEPKISPTAKGEEGENLPGSKSVAHTEDETRNLGGPALSCHTNYGSSAGRSPQREEEGIEGRSGVRSLRSSEDKQASGVSPNQGSDTSTQPPQATSTVRTTEPSWQTFLRAIATKAAQNPRHRFGDLYRKLNEDNLRECFKHLRKDAAPGVDGVEYEEYEKNLEANLTALVRRLKQKSYRTQLVRRKYIPKSPGKRRPLGILALEDKLVQQAVAQILAAIFEADFLPCSYGYRPGRSAHDAVRELTDELYRGNYEFVYEADIKDYFGQIRWDWLERMLGQRIQDGAILGLIGKWVRAGVMEEDGSIVHPERGTPQGGLVSPVLANVYLHYVLDLWYERRVKKTIQGGSRLFRYADDFVVVFGWKHEAEQFAQEIKGRLSKFGLELAEEKTKIIRFGRKGGDHNGRFDFLGFEFRWEKSRSGWPIVKRRTAPKKLKSAVSRFQEWIRRERHGKLSQMMDTLRAKYQGHWNYYGRIGNFKSLRGYWGQTTRLLFKWLNRRSQRRSYTWESFNRLLERFRIPAPRITEEVQRKMGEMSELRRWTENATGVLASVNLLGNHYVRAGARAS